MVSKSWLAACVAACLVACGGGGGGGAGGGAGAGAPTTEAPASNLALAASFGDPLVPAGGTTTLTITVTNNGSGAARGIELFGEWGDGFASDPDFTCSATGGAVCPPPTGSGVVPDIPPGGRLVFVAPVTLAASALGQISSTLFADAINDSQLSDNVTIAVVQAYRADVSVTGRGPSTPVQAGSSASYTMTVLNAGPSDAQNVSIQNTLGASQVSGTMSCLASGGAVCPATIGANMTVPRLPAHGSLVFTLPVQVAPGTSGSVSNAMTVSSAGDAVPTNNTATARISSYVAPLPGQTSVLLLSDANDYIGGGRIHSYTRANSVLSFSPNGGSLRVTVAGDEDWTGEFDLPSGVTQFVPGTYTNLTRAPFRNAAVGGLEWSGEGRGCNTLTGSITVNSASYSAPNVLDAIDLSFEQHCEGGSAALRGHVVWIASDATTPPGPVDPPPAGLWAPAANATPASGSYVYLQSDAGDYVGAGRTHTYTKADSILSMFASGTRVAVGVAGDQNWSGDFVTMNSLTQLQPGYYPNLRRYPFNNPAMGGLSWSGESRGCGQLTGWMVVDSVTWNGSSLATLDLRFEQHCEGMAPALHGKIHWDASDTTTPPGPVLPVPASLWAPPAGATPASGNYIYLASDSGDYIGQGMTSTTTTVSTFTGTGRVSVVGGGWTGEFQAMDGLAQLQVGYYGNLSRYPFHNHVRGGLDWGGNGRGCNTLQGWFAVDSVSYDASGLAAIDLRFEQHCDGITPALRGKVHWVR
jgi:uncharacterized repeat protein (TIGR01451 family)